jgi:hypothetical protein
MTIRHFWGLGTVLRTHRARARSRHIGTIEPLWNLFDLIPEGRGTGWDEQISYPPAPAAGQAAPAAGQPDARRRAPA